VIVIADANPIIFLSTLGKLDLLRKLYDRVLIPRAVYGEVVVQGEGQPGSRELKQADWIEVVEVPEDHVLRGALLEDLDAGESEAIVLAVEMHAGLIIMDERRGRRVAQNMGLVVRGTLGVLVEARRKRLVPAITPLLDQLLSEGFRASKTVIAALLAAVDEGP